MSMNEKTAVTLNWKGKFVNIKDLCIFKNWMKLMFNISYFMIKKFNKSFMLNYVPLEVY